MEQMKFGSIMDADAVAKALEICIECVSCEYCPYREDHANCSIRVSRAAYLLRRYYEKHLSECVQIAHYDDELRMLREVNADQANKLIRAQERIRQLEEEANAGCKG